MGARSFVCLTNIPTPYRIFQFRLMYQELAAREWDFEVLFMARWERGRNWSFEESEFSFPHRFLRGIHINAGGCAWHLNVGILSTLRQIRPEILLVGGSWTTPTVWIAGIARTAHRKIFWSESHLDSIRRRSRLTRLARRGVLSRFGEFATPGVLAGEYIERHARGRIYDFPNVVDPSIFQNQVHSFRKTSRRSDARRVLLIVARLAPEKGLLPFLSALLLLSASERSRLTVLIAGVGPAFNEIKRWIDTHDLDVKLLGHKGQAEIAALYAQADGFCLPSLSDPNPLSVIEALWAGLPLLLSSRVGNYPECLQDGENGFCFDPSAPKSICDAVSRWLKLSTGQLDGFGAVSARVAQEKFAPREEIRNFLNEVLEPSISRFSAAHAVEMACLADRSEAPGR